MLPLLLASKVSWKRVGIGAGIAVLVGLIAGLCTEFLALRKARLAYEHPRVITVTQRFRVEGPVRTVTKIVREPSGREETTREEIRGPVVESSDGRTLSEPVFQPEARPPRWIVGGSLANFRYADRTAYTVWGGATLAGRLDLEGGLDGDFRTTRLKVSWRF